MPAIPPRKRSAVPESRFGRLLRLGLMGGELAVGTVLAGARELSAGRLPNVNSTVLTPGNAERLARRLATLRGPAMKVGQMLSLHGGDVLPVEFRNALAALQSQGYSMTDAQLHRVLGREYGTGWQLRFTSFDPEPVAAASIGQVHRAVTADGRSLALKIQFPGVARSVDSDVDNLAALLRALEFLPVTIDIAALTAEVKRQLRLETDYLAEADNLERYGRLVAGLPTLLVPRVDRELTTRRILAADYVEGEPLESLASEAVPQATRNAVGRALTDLMFREIFEFGVMQTDPNFANYLYAPATRRIALLDFGSVCDFPPEFVDRYRRICRAVIARDRAAIRDAALEIGYVHRDDPDDQVRAAVDIVELACEPISHRGAYDFGESRLIARGRDLIVASALGQGLRSPPPETLFLHRKLVGNFLVCARLRARIDVRRLLEPFL